MSKVSKWYSKTTAAIPGVRIWEHVLMVLAVSVGIRGFAGESVAYLALGPWAWVFWILMILGPIVFESGQFMRPPNGLVVSIMGALMVSGACIVVYSGLAVAIGSIWFPGYATLLVVGIGGIARAIQMFAQLARLTGTITKLDREVYGAVTNNDIDSSGSDGRT